MTASLLWKDFRLTVPSLLTGCVLFGTSFISVFLMTRSLTPGPFPWFEAVIASAHFCQWSMVAVGALLGGTLFAAEKEDASQSFLHALPLRRADIVTSKLIVALLAFETLWIAIAVIVHVDAPFTAFGSRERLPGAAGMIAIAAVSFSVLGTSWFWSVLVSKPILAALNGLLTAATLVGGFTFAAGLVLGAETSLDTATPWAILTGVVGLSLGARTYLAGTVEKKGGSRRTDHIDRSVAAPQHVLGNAPNRSTALQSLLWKDFLLSRALLIGGSIVLAIPYVYVAAQWSRAESPLELLARASTQSLWLSCIVFAAWGGYAVAAERASRTDHFLHSLPVAVRTAALSRLLLTFVPAALIYLANIAALLALHELIFQQSPVDEEVSGLFEMDWVALIWQPNSLLFGIPAFGMPLLCFAVAWFGAISLNRPFLGIGLGCATPGLVLVLWLSFIASTGEALFPVYAGFVFMVLGAVAACSIIALGCQRAERLDYA